MKVEQRIWTKTKGWSLQSGPDIQDRVQLVILFGATDIMKEQSFFPDVKKM